jgi:hypothetical protein
MQCKANMCALSGAEERKHRLVGSQPKSTCKPGLIFLFFLETSKLLISKFHQFQRKIAGRGESCIRSVCKLSIHCIVPSIKITSSILVLGSGLTMVDLFLTLFFATVDRFEHV